jgi:hypothetical protein
MCKHFLRPRIFVPDTKQIPIRQQLMFESRIMANRQDAIAEVGKSAPLVLVGFFPVWQVVIRPVTKHTNTRQSIAVVIKIGFRIDRLLRAMLGTIWQPPTCLVQQLQEFPFQAGVLISAFFEPRVLFISASFGLLCRRGLEQQEQKVAYEMSVNQRVSRLVGVTEQAVIAGTTAFIRPARTLVACARIEVASIESLLSNPRKRIRVFDQALPNSVSSLGSLPIEQSAVFSLPNLFERDLLLFYLKQ